MQFLFIHQNYPGQYRHLAAALASQGHGVVAIGEDKPRPQLPYPIFTYSAPRSGSAQTHHYLRDFEGHVRRGQQVFKLCRQLKQQGFIPDVIYAHPGWGEALFIRDAFPSARLILFCEFYYRSTGSDMNFDPEYPSDLDGTLRVRMKNSTQLQSLASCDCGISPTKWQQSQYPEIFRSRIHICHDGIDTQTVCPDDTARLQIDETRFLTPKDTVVTYVARNLEPYRGFHSFMRTVPHIQQACPEAHIVIIGGQDVSYGRRLPQGESYRTRYASDPTLNLERIHFLNRVPYPAYLSALQISSAHVYLTYPFVLSWSCLEAMSAGCALVASQTPPVQEVITHEHNGLLVDFFAPEDIATAVTRILRNPRDYRTMRNQARQTVQKEYDLHTVSLPRQIQIVTTS